MSKEKLLYLLFPTCGVVGFFLRLIQLQFGFDRGTGLATVHFLPGTALLLLAAVLCLAACAVSFMLPVCAPAKSPEQHRVPRIVHTATAILTALMGLLLLPSGLSGSRLDLLLALASICTALYFLLVPYAGKGLRTFCCFEYTLFYVAWLVVLFSRHASDPILIAFWPPLLALCATAFSFYFLACAACDLKKPRRCLFSLLTGGSLCLIAAADGSTPYLCGFLAAALIQLFYAYKLLFQNNK